MNEEKLNEVNVVVDHLEEKEDDIVSSLISSDRYDKIFEIMKNAGSFKSKEKLTISDRIDKIVTNRFLAIPIFAAVMFLVYYLSISTIGGFFTDWGLLRTKMIYLRQ